MLSEMRILKGSERGLTSNLRFRRITLTAVLRTGVETEQTIRKLLQ